MCSDRDTCIRTLGPPLVSLLEKVVRLLEGRTLVEEVYHCDQALRVYSFAPFLVLAYCFLDVDEKVTHSLLIPSAMPSYHDGHLALCKHKPK